MGKALLSRGFLILLAETIDSPFGVYQLFLSGIQWVTLRADLQFYFTVEGRADFEGGATSTAINRWFVCGMNVSFHSQLLGLIEGIGKRSIRPDRWCRASPSVSTVSLPLPPGLVMALRISVNGLYSGPPLLIRLLSLLERKMTIVFQAKANGQLLTMFRSSLLVGNLSSLSSRYSIAS
jgi:hypothetical protein